MRYTVYCSFTIRGRFFVEAEDKDQARDIVLRDCGMSIDAGIHSTLPEDKVDWEFNGKMLKKVELVVEDKHSEDV